MLFNHDFLVTGLPKFSMLVSLEAALYPRPINRQTNTKERFISQKDPLFFVIGIVGLLSVCLHCWFTHPIFSKQANPTAFFYPQQGERVNDMLYI